jgi:tRNA (mo5U34)-methyltransferase
MAGAELADRVASVPVWFHSIDLGGGIVTPGMKDAAHLQDELEALRLPDLEGRSVLDIGAWDGFYSFEAESRGAARVVALDHYVWSLDLEGWMSARAELRRRGEPVPAAPSLPGLWQPEELPGKRGFDLAHEVLGSRAEFIVADFMELDPAELGRFDVVFFLGVLYHLQDPLEALRRVAAVTKEVAVIETEAIEAPGLSRPIWEFFPGDELESDPSNWWVPNLPALEAICLAAGFTQVESIELPSSEPRTEADGLRRFRAAAHAWR